MDALTRDGRVINSHRYRDRHPRSTSRAAAAADQPLCQTAAAYVVTFAAVQGKVDLDK